MLATARLAIAIALASALRSQLPEPLPAKTYFGRVVDETGAPLAGVGVLIGEPDELTAAAALRDPTTRTDAAGRFSVAIAESAATRELMFAIKGHACAYHAPRLNRVYSFVLGAVTDGEIGEVCLPPAVELHGRVVGEDGKPIADATVAAVDALRDRVAEPTALPTWYGSAARTSADGRFVLPGVFATGLVMTVSARGHYSHVLRPVDRSTPLTFTLRVSGMCRGRVVDAVGQPLAARLWVAYEGGSPEQRTIATRADGAFEFTVAHPGRFRVWATPEGHAESGESVICVAPRDDLEVRLAAPTREYAVRATAADGTPITEFRAGGQWFVEAEGVPGEWLSFLQPTTTARDGVARLAKPGRGEPDRGRVVVAAEGFARQIVGDVVWDAGKPELVVQLDPEASVAGKVIGADGQPLAGVRVRIAPISRSPMMRPARRDPQSESRSAADGAFRIGGLRAGDYEVSAVPSHLPPTTPFKVTVAKAEAKTGVTVPVARGTTLRGKLKGVVLDRPVRVVVDAPEGETNAFEEAMTGISFGDSSGRAESVNADGSFVVAGLPSGRSTLWLEVNAHPRTHLPVRISLGQLRLGEVDREEEFDVTGKLQTTVRGKVTFTGPTVPTTRLVATAEIVERGRDVFTTSWTASSRAPLDANGEFTLRVAPGKLRIAIFDLLTGLELTDEEPLTVPTEGATCELRLELGRVLLKVRQPETPVIVTRLELRNVARAERWGRMMFDVNYDRRTGILLAPGQDSVEVVARLGDLMATARNNASAIGAPPETALGQERATVIWDKVVELEVPVTAPALGDRQR